MTKLNFHTVKSFKYAYEGLKAVYIGEANFRTHLVFTVIILVSAIILEFNTVEMAILFLTIGLVLILELVNTAVEETINLVSPNISEKAKLMKDVAAASVMLAALLSVVIGLLLFIPRTYLFLLKFI